MKLSFGIIIFKRILYIEERKMSVEMHIEHFDEFSLKDLNSYQKVFSITYMKDPKYFKPHRHNFVEFMYIESGEGYETINSLKYKLAPGTFSMVLPYQIHKIEYDKGSPLNMFVGVISFEALLLPNSMFYQLGKLLLRYDEDILPYYYFAGQLKTKLDFIFNEIMTLKLADNNIWNDIIMCTKLIEAITLFDMQRKSTICLSVENPPSIQINEPNKAHPIENNHWDIVYYVHKNYNQPIDLKTLAEVFHLSPSYISQLFKKMVGNNFHKFLNEIRIQNACALLVSTDKSITDVALEVGFDSYSTFARVFNQYKGMSAFEYRKRYLQSNIVL